MKQVRVVLGIALLVVGIALSSAWPVAAQGVRSSSRYYAATGHNVQGDFLTFFDSKGGEAIFGVPRTEEFVENGLKVQYFQRAKMEFHPENYAPYRVQLALLGDLLGYRQPALASYAIPPANHPQRRYYTQTGHTVSYGFLTFFDANGGLDIFGYPISEPMMEQGVVVQYFQRTKMSWHPELAYGQQISLANLGDEYITRIALAGSYLARTSQATPNISTPLRPTTVIPSAYPDQSSGTSTTSPTAIDFDVAASVKYRNTGQGGYQTVYVRAADSTGHGVNDAQVQITVHFRSGDQVFRAPNTDASGNSSFAFNIGYPPAGYTVVVDVRVTAGGRSESGQTSFVPWW